MARGYEQIVVDRRGDVVLVTLDLPERRNALTVTMASELAGALDDAVAADARVAVITGAGDGFCSGGDIGTMSASFGSGDGEGSAWRARDGVLTYYRHVLRVAELPIPTIAAINGAAVGAGLNLALACDVRIAARGAKLHASFLRIGLPPGMGASWLLTQAVGATRAAELVYSGRGVEAEEAERIGLVSRVVEPESLLDEALGLAERIAGGPPIATRMTKEALRLARTADHETVLQFEAMAQGVAAGTEDVREGLEAFLEKRRPTFRGR